MRYKTTRIMDNTMTPLKELPFTMFRDCILMSLVVGKFLIKIYRTQVLSPIYREIISICKVLALSLY